MKKVFTLILAAATALGASSQVVVKGGGVTVKKTSEAAQMSDEIVNEFEKLGEGKYTALYDYKVNTQDKQGNPVSELYATALRIGDDGAVFTDYITYSADSLAAAGAPAQAVEDERRKQFATENFFVPVITQNIPMGKTVVNDQSAVTIVSYEEPFADIEWFLTEDTDTLAGYNIAKATGSYGGRKWTVWYTEEIPAAYGPWKLAGLPGLVVKASDADGIHEFKLISFTKSNVPLLRAKDKRTVKTDRDKFVGIKNSQAQNPMKSINPSMITDITVKKTGGDWGSIFVNGIQQRTPVNIYQPLELK